VPQYCPITYSISKWEIPILWKLILGDGQHYNHLKRMVGGITNTMLTKSLRELENDGLIVRHSEGTVHPSVSYHLTDLGKELHVVHEEYFIYNCV